LHYFDIDNTLPVSGIDPHQDIFIWGVQQIEKRITAFISAVIGGH
jgi:hypothetical protein